MMEVEQHFGIKIPMRMIDKLATFDDFAEQAEALAS
jgi:acyl carrier protein